MNSQKVIYRLAIDSMMAALYFVLAYFSFSFGNVRITIASLVIVMVSFLYSTKDSLMVALIGELINQCAKYGFTPTTALWILPVLLRALLLSLFATLSRRRGQYLENRTFLYYFSCLFVSLIVTVVNTGILFFDGFLMNYPVSFTLIETLFRFLSSIVTSFVVSSISLPILRSLNRLDINRIKIKSDRK